VDYPVPVEGGVQNRPGQPADRPQALKYQVAVSALLEPLDFLLPAEMMAQSAPVSFPVHRPAREVHCLAFRFHPSLIQTQNPGLSSPDPEGIHREPGQSDRRTENPEFSGPQLPDFHWPQTGLKQSKLQASALQGKEQPSLVLS